MAITTLNNRSINRSDTASAGQLWTATSATASDFQASSAASTPAFFANITSNQTVGTASATKLTIDAAEKTSGTAATAAVISDTSLANNALMTVDIDGVGSSTAGAGLKIYLIGYQT